MKLIYFKESQLYLNTVQMLQWILISVPNEKLLYWTSALSNYLQVQVANVTIETLTFIKLYPSFMLILEK